MRKAEEVIDGPVNQSRLLADGTIVQRYNIVGVDVVAYDAWRLDKRQRNRFGDYSTCTYIDGVLYGAVGTERLPAELEAIPAWTDERIHAVRAWMAARIDERNSLIRAAFSEAADAKDCIFGFSVCIPGVADQARYENWLELHPVELHEGPPQTTTKYSYRSLGG